MTAINFWRNKDKAVLMTDGVGYTADLVVRSFYAKCVTIPHLGAAVAVRGSTFLPGHMAQRLGESAASFDELLQDVGQTAWSIFEQVAPMLEDRGFGDIDMILAGWSEEEGQPIGVVISSTDHDEEQVFAWEPVRIPDLAFMPWPNSDLLTQQAPDVIETKDFNPDTHGVRLLELQRREKIRPWVFGEESEVSGSIVGGFALATEITAEGVSQRVVHRWKDQIGERINPDTKSIPSIGNRPRTFNPNQAAAPANAAGMSRQQRRAAARMAAKRSA